MCELSCIGKVLAVVGPFENAGLIIDGQLTVVGKREDLSCVDFELFP